MEIQWRKSSYSTDAEGSNCVELGRVGDTVYVRESDDPDAVIATTPEKLLAFLRGAKDGEFDDLV
ncbi:DUF397 domain-containing protein [Streptomyces silvensis]|uniref:DUF397 domain-containing protein n=1 Tax=Streptomyces silvensis TaxID=1765722 RepID=A0A0W7X9L8_9ACTN|nr:DUF397 domain-containing protein [Streptomyces silvensis]KUF19599.1 DUF397 domain-containing protein [Streptomyces silvensis]